MAALLALCFCALSFSSAQAAQPEDAEDMETLRLQYQAYQDSFLAIEHRTDIMKNGFIAIEDQSFPVVLESFGEDEVIFLPVMDENYNRLAVLILDDDGNVLYKTDQLETNYKYPGELRQPTKAIAAVAFQDLDQDGLLDIVLLTDCENDTGAYAGKTYKTGDVLFQGEGCFYRDWRISDKINRFSMNKSAKCIISYVRDGNSTEALYTASTLKELLENGFQVAQEQRYFRNFEKQGRLEVVPGVMHMSDYDVFMIYLVNEQGDIVWSFQPMRDYDNLYALKGMTCRDMDGDGMKDIVVLARYSYTAPSEDELQIDTRCSIYYQRTDGFEEDTGFEKFYQCTEEDTVNGLVEIIRKYWGWTDEE